MRTAWAALALAALANMVAADIEFLSPKAGAKLEGGTSIVVEWKDSGTAPALKDLTTYQLFLCAGGNKPGEFDDLLTITLTPVAFAVTGNKATGTIGVTLGASTPNNAYFLKMISTAVTGGTVTNFSPRFSLSGMTGVFSAPALVGLKGVSGTDGPARIDATSNGKPAAPAAGDYDMEYTMQTGPTRYAPMPPIPPTKISKKNATPQHPTSSVQIAKTFLPIPVAQTTITQSQTFSVESRTNTAAAAPMPSDDMGRFLARWKD